MKRSTPAVILVVVLTAVAPGCGDAETLTAEQQDAYSEVVSYRTDPEAVVRRSYEAQQAAAKRYARNLRTLEAADLGEDEALSTLRTCTLQITEGSDPEPDPAACDAALEAVRGAVDQRLR